MICFSCSSVKVRKSGNNFKFLFTDRFFPNVLPNLLQKKEIMGVTGHPHFLFAVICNKEGRGQFLYCNILYGIFTPLPQVSLETIWANVGVNHPLS